MSKKTDSKNAKAVPQGERAPAAKAAARAQRVPHADKTQYRRDAILAELSTRTAKTTGTLWLALEDTFGYRRKLERDLKDLQNADLIRRDGDGWWDNREKDVLAEHATYTALRLLQDLVNDVVPKDLRDAIEKHLEKAKTKLKNMPPNDPAVRWVRAFRVLPPRHRLDDPVIREDVQKVIQTAILTHHKVRLKWPNFRYDEDHERVAYVEEQECSISHYLIEVPANPYIEIWYGKSSTPHRLQVCEVLEAEILPEMANYPPDYKPEMFPSRIGMRFGDADQHAGQSLVTLAMPRATYSVLLRKKLGELLTIVDEDRDGYMIVSFRYPLDVPITQYFENLPGVTVLGPKIFRAFAMGPTRAKSQAYRDTAELARILADEEEKLAKGLMSPEMQDD